MAKKVRAARPVPALQVMPEQWPAFAIERRRASQLRPHPRNVRTHSQDQIEQLSESFAEHGVVKPFVIDENNVILAGHGSTLAAKRFGDVEVPVVVARGWTEQQKLTFMLRDNRIAENAGWDKVPLGLQLAELRDIPTIDLAMLGFKPAELDRLIKPVDRVGFTDPDAPLAPPDADAAPISRPGDLWLLGEHRLFCGDATNPGHVEAALAGECPGLMVTDPPYGVNYDPAWREAAYAQGRIGSGSGAKHATGQVTNDHLVDWSAAWSLFPGDVAYIWHASLFTSAVQASIEACGFDIRAMIIWAKNKFAISQGHYHWQHEPCWYAVRAGATGNWHGDRSQSTLWSIANNGGPDGKKQDTITGHGTQKPIECMKRPIINNSQPGDAVYDPFVGSGTTILAAEMTARRARALEIDPAYCDLAILRWEGFTKKCAIRAAGDLTMAEAASARGIVQPTAAQPSAPAAAALAPAA